jgi:hypothetical protein
MILNSFDGVSKFTHILFATVLLCYASETIIIWVRISPPRSIRFPNFDVPLFVHTDTPHDNCTHTTYVISSIKSNSMCLETNACNRRLGRHRPASSSRGSVKTLDESPAEGSADAQPRASAKPTNRAYTNSCVSRAPRTLSGTSALFVHHMSHRASAVIH